MKDEQRLSEIEYCLDRYFRSHFVPLMHEVKADLQKKQQKEFGEYNMSTAGIIRQLTNELNNVPDDSLAVLRMTGEWNSKTTEDYVAMCGERIAGSDEYQRDLQILTAQWRDAIVSEIGRERYDSISEQLGSDLAASYVDYRMEQLMVDQLVKEKTPKSTMEYIVSRAAEGSLLGLPNVLMRTPLDEHIAEQSEKAYNPSTGEVAGAKVGSIAADAMTLGIMSWTSILKYGVTDVAFTGIGEYLGSRGDKPLTIEQCISQGVFGSEDNVFKGLREKGKEIKTWENPYILAVNEGLTKKMNIYTEKPPIDFSEKIDFRNMDFENMKPVFPLRYTDNEKEQLPNRENIPSVVTPGKEEEYLRHKEESKKRSENQTKEKFDDQSDEKTQESMPATTLSQTKHEQATQTTSTDNTNTEGWANLLSATGTEGLGDVTRNLGYVVAMLPDLFFGMFNGKTNLRIKDNLMPIASVLLGLFVRNPLLKMVLIGMGGANLLNKAGHEAIEKEEAKTDRLAGKPRVVYKRYQEERLDPRIESPQLKGGNLVAVIDRVPCSIRLLQTVIDAYEAGALPLSTLANAVLRKHDQMQTVIQTASRNYDITAEEYRGQERNVAIK